MEYTRTYGVVTDVAKQGWFQVNTKCVRSHSLDGARFPHIATIEYTAGENVYILRKWISYNKKPPEKGDKIPVIYNPEKPKKAKAMLNDV